LTAAEYGDAAIVEAMLRRGAQVDVPNEEGQTAIWLCSKVSDNRAVSCLFNTLQSRIDTSRGHLIHRHRAVTITMTCICSCSR
jgi:ankyrin repeat protein